MVGITLRVWPWQPSEDVARRFGSCCSPATVDDARQQATYEYDDSLMPWVDVPADIADAHAFAIHYAAERLDNRGDW